MTDLALDIASRVEAFVRGTVFGYEQDPRWETHGPSAELVAEMRAAAKAAGVLTPHILPGGKHLSQRETALVLQASGLSPLGPVAVNTAAPDEGNMLLLGRVATIAQRARYLAPLVAGETRSSFLMTEPASENGAGSDPSLLRTAARRQGDEWVIDGRKTFVTGIDGASCGIIMARTGEEATMFLAPLPNPAVRIERIIDTIDSTMPGGHAVVTIEDLRLTDADVLGEIGRGFEYAQVRLAPARLSHCMRWLGAAKRAHAIASDYACRRRAFGRLLIDHEGVGFQLADNVIDLRTCEQMIAWCADELDSGKRGSAESSVTKVAVSEALFRIADRCVQVMGATGISDDTVVARIFREIRAFRIYDGPTEVHKFALARRIRRSHLGADG
ncbi:acyl-CoA dehydrogenase family protein [Novosphingobium aquae]|uniref:Acyl-CoA dehydrogenase family protein n=1 Tax=Novosphingobium aquae TaxID=3133435 RepID=A0ABU8SA28_9SPHN